MANTHTTTLIRLLAAFLILTAAAYLIGLNPNPFFHAPEQTNTQPAAANAPAPAASEKAAYIGAETCAGCHQTQTELWRGSHHDLAMQVANPQTVLGDFNQAKFNKDNVASEFYRQDQQFWVKTDGPDGKPAAFQVKYTFGVQPLQQYLVELPGGRLQALSIAWDSRSKEQGGQRWFHLYPNEHVDYRDELHWTKPAQNWNFMCAECHSTRLEKNFDAQTASYHTQWAEINVACEACHGPGSVHVAQAKQNQFDPNLGLAQRLRNEHAAAWSGNAQGHLQRSQPLADRREIEVCAPCHSRRGQWFPSERPDAPLLDSHQPGLLTETLYHPDGQIDGEVYEYGSFLQSKMYQAGVTCTNCHEPHSLKPRAPGNGVCEQCHAADKYASKQHHQHAPDSAGGQCISCHMPTKDYMVVHTRHDHRFSIPRPDWSAQFGAPNACTNCHTKKSAAWAAAALKKWYGRTPEGYQQFAPALYAGRHGGAEADALLTRLIRDRNQPGIARATALSEMRRRLNKDNFPAIVNTLDDADPLVRIGAMEALEPLPAEQRWLYLHKLLKDPLRVVRNLAVEVLADAPPEKLDADDKTLFDKLSAEYIASHRFNADSPAAQVNLGNFLATRGDLNGAEAAYRAALKLDPDWIPAYVNFSDYYRLTGRDQEGEALLKAGIARRPQAAALHHSLGLLLIRQKQMPAALESLRQASQLAPDDSHFRYVYALALQQTGDTAKAQDIARLGLQRNPADPLLKELTKQLSKKGQS